MSQVPIIFDQVYKNLTNGGTYDGKQIYQKIAETKRIICVVKALNEAEDEVRKQQWRKAGTDERKALKGKISSDIFGIINPMGCQAVF